MKSVPFYLSISLLIVCIGNPVNAQIISQFTWDADPVTAAIIGPDATSVSTSAFSDAGGTGGTNGLNAGLPKLDVNMVIPGSATFDINGIDVSFDYQREESIGTFVRRGASLSINGCANLSVSYRVDDGLGGFATVSSGNVYAIPNDDTYRNYRFYYMPATGEGALLVDGAIVWTNNGPDSRNLYWTGAGDLEVGVGVDGTGLNNTFMDNLIIANIFDSPLPIELNYFTAEPSEGPNVVNCLWETLSEVNNDFFNVQRSVDGVFWSSIGEIDGAGNSFTRTNYSFVDGSPLPGISYYRLKQTDFDGHNTVSSPVSVNFKYGSTNAFTVYPNPSKDNLIIEMNMILLEEVKVFNMLGQVVQIQILPVINNRYSIDVSNLNAGVYIIQIEGVSCYFIKE